MMSAKYWTRKFVKAFLRIVFSIYYRTIQVKNQGNFPRVGPVLLVANHPNSLVDPAILIHLLPRPVHFGARHGLFAGPLRHILKAFGAIPIYRLQDAPAARRRNLTAIERYTSLLQEGAVAAIFPEGVSRDDPHLEPIKNGAARIALKAESGSQFELGLKIIPVGLQFEPRRKFRADAFLRFGVPITFGDLKELNEQAPRQAVQELSNRIDHSLKKLAFHVESSEYVPFIERLAEIYLLRIRTSGLSGVDRKGLRGELLYRMAASLNHYTKADPQAVASIEKALEHYEKLRKEAGARRRLLEEPPRLLPGPFAIGQASVEALLGAVPALFGLLTNGVPYFVTRGLARQIIARFKHPSSFSISHILVGSLAFPLAYGLEIAWVWRHFSDIATITFTLLLAPTGLFALAYFNRMRKLVIHLGGRISSWFKLDAVARAAAARDDLICRLDHMRDRYRVEVLGWTPVPSPSPMRWRRLVPWAAILVIVLFAVVALEMRDRRLKDLRNEPSPWSEMRGLDPDVMNARLEQDARGTAAAVRELDQLESRMNQLRAEFIRGERSYYSQEDQDAIHRLLLTYLNLRTALLRTIWIYRSAHDDPRMGESEARAFLLAYASAATLFEKAAVIVETFQNDSRAQQKLNQGDLAWELPEGTYDRLLANLSNADVVSELRAATERFDQLRTGGAYSTSPWSTLVEAALGTRSSIDYAAAKIDERKLRLALRNVNRLVRDPVQRTQVMVSTWIGDYRLKDRPRHRGLISPRQVDEMRPVLEPGDILLERRNWFLSNAFLPGFWPHAAFYLGTPEELEALGVTSNPWVVPKWEEFLGSDAAGHPHAVIEAISEGVVFTSLEHSVGEADAVAILRPRLTDAQRREAIIRAFSHLGKPYDFQFDFFSTHRLVCSEVVYRAYDGMVDLPLTNIMGRQTLPVNTFVEVYADHRGNEECPFELVRFLDMDERSGRAVLASDEAFLDTLHRSRFTFFQPR
jgi:1-acyl-sn-glycerol-3-phosphate acyltransferase